jgi:hypothetical protein
LSPEAVDDVLARFTALSAEDRARVIRHLEARRESQPPMTQASLDRAAEFAVGIPTDLPDPASRVPESVAARAWRERIKEALIALALERAIVETWDLMKLAVERFWLGGDEASLPPAESPSEVTRALAEARPGDRRTLQSAVLTPPLVDQWLAGTERELTAQLQARLRAARDAAPEAAIRELPPVSEREARKLVLTFFGALASPPESR